MRLTSDKLRQATFLAGVLSAVGAGAYWLLVRPAQESHKVLQSVPAGSRLIDNVLPIYEFRGVVSTVIHATPEQIFRALAAVSLTDMPLANALIQARYLPGLLMGKPVNLKAIEAPILQSAQGTGNIVLAKAPNRELVIGVIGKFHQILDQQPVTLQNPRQFSFFVNPAYQKLAMSWAIGGGNDQDGYRFIFESRTHALSAQSRRQFALYWWLMIKLGSDLMARMLVAAVKRRAEEMAKVNL